MKKLIFVTLFICIILSMSLPCFALPEKEMQSGVTSKPLLFKEDRGTEDTKPVFLQTETAETNIPSKLTVVDSTTVSVKYDIWIIRFVKKLMEMELFGS